jgi:hypothetical protein
MWNLSKFARSTGTLFRMDAAQENAMPTGKISEFK